MCLNSDNITIEDQELYSSFLKTATLACILTGKKLNFQNLFVLLFENKKFNKIAKIITECDKDIEMASMLLKIDPSLVKSKILRNFKINAQDE
jgi:hypothetical protein